MLLLRATNAFINPDNPVEHEIFVRNQHPGVPMQSIVVTNGRIFIKAHLKQLYKVARASEVVSTQLFPVLHLHLERKPGRYMALLEIQLFLVPW